MSGSSSPHPAPVSVILDAQPLSGVAADGGIGTYTRHLLEALADRPDIALSALSAPSVTLPPGVRRINQRRRARRPRLEVIEHAIRLPLEVRRHRGEGTVFHNPSFHAPPAIGAPWVQTLHDVIPLVFDAPDQAALRARWRRFGPRYLRADAVVAITRHAADEGMRVLGLDPARLHVIHHGVDPAYRPGGAPADPPYLLVVSQYSQRKGFAQAFGVMDQLVDSGAPHRLVVAGRIHDWARAELEALRTHARHPERIELRGLVDDLLPLYQGAAAFLMTSRYEGFGLPALEAMACGIPVVSFSNSALPEVIGEGGLLVPDGDVAAMAAAVTSVLESPERAIELRQAGLARASQFTWARSAAQHGEVFHSVVRH